MNHAEDEAFQGPAIKTSRSFSVWDFHSSFSRLLIRSVGNETQQNIDLIFGGVFYMDAPFWFTGLEIVEATEEELDSLESRTQTKMRAGKLTCQFYVLRTGGVRYYVGASHLTVEQNSLGFMETSLGTRYAVPEVTA